jgi:hypothetical protein
MDIIGVSLSNCRTILVALRLEFRREQIVIQGNDTPLRFAASHLPIYARPEEDVHQDQIVLCPIHLVSRVLTVVDRLRDALEFFEELAQQLPVHEL